MAKTNIDRVKIEENLLPGDIIIAEVKSLSESWKVLISIWKDELGVIVSFDKNGDLLIPLNQ